MCWGVGVRGSDPGVAQKEVLAGGVEALDLLRDEYLLIV